MLHLHTLSPAFWCMLYKYDAVWDKQFQYLLSKYKFTHIDECTAMLGTTEIWIANYPYACFTAYNYNYSDFCHPYFSINRPSRYTIIKAHRQLIRDINCI
jgi:hypothetical protein